MQFTKEELAAVQFTKEALHELCSTVCPHCKAGGTLRYRSDTNEWVHDQCVVDGTLRDNAHAICWANGLRLKYST